MNNTARIREAVSIMNRHLHDANIDLKILPGGDVRVDERICELLKTDKVMTLCDEGKYLLLELPSQVFIEIAPLLVELNKQGISVIISHPERYRMVVQKPQVLEKWLEHGASLQITAGSLLGQFGKSAQTAAWSFLQRGWVQFVATDAHDTQLRIPCISIAFERIKSGLGQKLAREVCIENPMRVLRGEHLPEICQSSTTGCQHGGFYN
jgi:protein-tyrosine phosphatase